jgi:hypothetical protein
MIELKFKNGWNVSLSGCDFIKLTASKENCDKVFSLELPCDELPKKVSEIKELGDYDYIKWRVDCYDGDDFYGWYRVGNHEYFDHEPTDDEVYDLIDKLDGHRAEVYDTGMNFIKRIN